MEKNTTIIFPVPVDLLAGLHKLVLSDIPKAESSPAVRNE